MFFFEKKQMEGQQIFDIWMLQIQDVVQGAAEAYTDRVNFLFSVFVFWGQQEFVCYKCCLRPNTTLFFFQIIVLCSANCKNNELRKVVYFLVC